MGKKLNTNISILSVESKDLLTKNYVVGKNHKFKASLDDSLEVDKLKELNKKIIKFNKKTKRYYSEDIMTVTFKYACKGDIDLTDEEYERVESLKLTKELLSDRDEIADTSKLLKIAQRKINKQELREQIYRYGFNIVINGELKHFVRYKRSSGSARVGKCLFINEKYHKAMNDWSFSGLPHKENTEMDCSSLESYISLPTSSCVDRFKLRAENILLIEDGSSTFTDKVMATRLINEEYDEKGNVISGDLDTNIEETEITNKIWDGESLLDKSIFEESGYGDKAILQLRNRFFKGIGINTDIQKFFRDNNITDISQLNGKTIAKRVEDIKLITTPSSVKYLKYGDFETWLDYVVEDWGICKYEKPQHHFNGMVQTHYQLLNTLGMSYDTMGDFLQDTIDYIKLLKTDTAVFKYHLGLRGVDEDGELGDISSMSDFVLGVLNKNDDFINTKVCKKFRDEIIHSYIKNVRKGHVLVEGNYSVVISSPLEYLKASIGMWNGESLIQPYECVTSKFPVGDEVLGVRSPQPTMCNMNVFRNRHYIELDEYFNTSSKEVIFISAIGWNIFELESSMDVDGDAMLITNNKHIIESANKLTETIELNGQRVKRFLVSTDFTPKSSIKRKYNWRDLADTDIKSSSNKIGEIINLAQMLNSVYWNKKYNGCSEEELFELYKDICQLNILSCIEIDRCKKLSPVDAGKELRKIRDKGYLSKGKITRNKVKVEVGVRPYFFKFLDGGRDYKFNKFHTGMDYLEQILDKECKKVKDEKSISLVDILDKPDSRIPQSDRNKTDRLIQHVNELRNETSLIWSDDTNDNKYDSYIEILEIYNKKISKIEITYGVIYTILSRMQKGLTNNKYEMYVKNGRQLLTILFNIDRYKLISLFKVSKNQSFIEESSKCDIKIYQKSFKKRVF